MSSMYRTFGHTKVDDLVFLVRYNSKEREYSTSRCRVLQWNGNVLTYQPIQCPSYGVMFTDRIDRDDMDSDLVYVDYNNESGDFSILCTAEEVVKNYLISERDDFIEHINQLITEI